MIKEFKEFAIKGNVMDMAVGIIIGGAFGSIVNSLVKDVIMPPIGLILGKIDFNEMYCILKEGKTPGPYLTVDAAHKAGAITVNYGTFINNVVSFLIVAFSVFLMIKTINAMKKKKEEEPAAPAAPTKQEELLTEIRDALVNANQGK